MPVLTYEQPLNERVRLFLRLETLLARIGHAREQDSRWGIHEAVMGLLEVLALVARGDLKSEIIKELERQNTVLSPLRKMPGVDADRLTQLLEGQKQWIERLHSSELQLNQHLKDHEFLNAIRQRANVPGGVCDFNLPAYHFWLSRSAAERTEQLDRWLQPLREVERGVALALHLIRASGSLSQEEASAGFFQQNLDSQQPYQLLRVALPVEADFYPEVSAGKHRFSIRFMSQPSPDARPVQVAETVPFGLACCAL